MKPILGFIITIVLFIILCIGAYYIHIKSNQSYTELNLTQLKEKIKNKDDFIIYIQSSRILEDQQFIPVFKLTVEEYNVPAYYIEVKDMTDDDFAEVLNIVNISRTPTVAFIIDGIEKDPNNRIVGYTDDSETKNNIINKLKANNYIK